LPYQIGHRYNKVRRKGKGGLKTTTSGASLSVINTMMNGVVLLLLLLLLVCLNANDFYSQLFFGRKK